MTKIELPPRDDPGGDLSEILDEAKLTGSHMLQGGKSMTSIIAEVRRELTNKLRSYISRRDAKMFNEGVKKGQEK